MRYNRLPEFAANIKAPVDHAIEDNRSIEDIAGIIEEIEMFACPVCGHIAPDHRWSEPFTCLVGECPCTGLPEDWEPEDEPELIAAIGEAIRA